MTPSLPAPLLRSSLWAKVIHGSDRDFSTALSITYQGPLHQARNPSNIVIADVNGAWMVKHLSKRSGTIKLLSENPLKEPILLNEGQELVVFGAVT